MSTILQSILTVAYVKHNYPWLSFHEKPRFEAISQKNAALLQEITWLVFNHTDVILLTIVLQDFKLISVYSIYLLVFEAIQNAIDTVQKSLQYRMDLHGENLYKRLIIILRVMKNFIINVKVVMSFGLRTIVRGKKIIH